MSDYRDINPSLELKQFVSKKINGEIAPAGYKLLEYVQSSGTEYIEVPYTPTNAQLAGVYIAIDYKAASTSGGQVNLYTGSQSWQKGPYIGIANAEFRYCLGDKEQKIGTVVAEANVRYLMELDVPNDIATVWDESGNVIVSANSLTKSAGGTERTGAILFGYMSGPNILARAMTIYRAVIKQDGEALFDFIPVKRISDNAIGMYDKVSKEFYGNDGTGTFTAGPEVPVDGGKYLSIKEIDSSTHTYKLFISKKEV